MCEVMDLCLKIVCFDFYPQHLDILHQYFTCVDFIHLFVFAVLVVVQSMERLLDLSASTLEKSDDVFSTTAQKVSFNS